MDNFDADNSWRCHQAIQLVCSKLIPYIQKVLETWHQNLQQTLSACTTPQTCPNKGKPKANKGSCKACVDWGNALELAIYPPNSSGTVSWSNINPTLLHNDPIEAAKMFVLRLQPGAVYSDVGDFDSASLLMIMMKFNEFHQGDKTEYDVIKKVFDVRNHLSHMKVNKDLRLNDKTTDDYFKDIGDLVTFFHLSHAQHFTQEITDNLLQTLQDIRIDAFDIDTCKQELSRVYEDKKGKISLFPFDFESVVDIDDIFVNLVLLKESFLPGKMEKVNLESYYDLFCLEKKNKGSGGKVLRVLVKGGPGSGKTTLAAKIAYNWAQCINNKSVSGLNKFQLLFALNMRYLDEDMSLVDAIFDQLLPYDSKVSGKGLEIYLKKHADKVAVILDGADEFIGKIAKSPYGNRTVDVVCNNMLCDSCVVVTTRPHRVSMVREFGQYAHVEVTGFTKTGVFEYIGKFFQVRTYTNEDELYKDLVGDKSDMEIVKEIINCDDDDNFHSTTQADNEVDKVSVHSFVKRMYHSPALLSMSCIPVILTMFCLLWSEAKRLPERLTSLYQEVFHYFTQRWLEKQNEDIDSENIESNILTELGQVALACLLQNRLFFSATEFKLHDVLENACNIGIVAKERKRSKLHLLSQYTFFHKTFQEFCAASFWAHLADVSQEEFSRYLSHINSRNVDSFEYVLLFCCGLSSKAADMILSHVVSIHADSVLIGNCCEISSSDKSKWRLGMRLLYESQSSKFVNKFTRWMMCDEVVIQLLNSSFSSHEKEPILDFFTNCFDEFVTNSETNGTYSKLIIKIMFVQPRKDVSISSFIRAFYPFVKTNIKGTSLMISSLLKYSKKPVTVQCNVKSSHAKTIPMTTTLVRKIRAGSILRLNIDFSSMEQSTFHKLHGEEKEKYESLLEILFMSLGLEISIVDSNAVYCKISQVPLNPYDISPLLNGMSSNPEGYSSPIRGFATNCKFSKQSMIHFLYKSKKLEELDIALPSESHIMKLLLAAEPTQSPSPLCVTPLLQVMQSNTLTSLSFELSSMSLEGSEEEIVRLFHRLQTLALHNANVNTNYWKSLFRKMAESSNSLRNFSLTGNVIGGKEVVISQSPVYVLGNENSMQKDKCELSLDGPFQWLPKALGLTGLSSITRIENAVEDLASVLRNLDVLERLDLSSTSLRSQDVQSLAQGLLSCSKLKLLDLSNNELSNAALNLFQIFRYLTNLTNLKLQNIQLHDKGVTALANSIHNLRHLEFLQLSGNSISFKGTYKLSQKLHHLSRLLLLDMAKNPIGDLGMLALCNSFKALPRLKYLHLAECEISSTGTLLLGLSLQFLPNLSQLNIARNMKIDPEGIVWLFENLGRVKELTHVNLDGIELPYDRCNESLRKYFDYIGWKSDDFAHRYEDSSDNNDVHEAVIKLKTLNACKIKGVLEIF